MKEAILRAGIRDDTERWHEHQRLRQELNGRAAQSSTTSSD